MNNLYDYVLHYNPYQKTWFAIPRTQYTLWFSDSSKNTGVKKAKTVAALIKMIK